ncbi:UNVERIFIED_CONTAM: hypothetical protein Slati_2753800 [Sesamum latifolium]|uniref:Uncharacterized protein n=1 Tax=Sesamum latifolium TaxID=2727402 RepID=A0AAW2VZ65_9LAMI
MEVLNRVLETYLCCFVSELPTHGFCFLHLVEFWYNSTHHSSIRMPPFQALYGPRPVINNYIDENTPIVAVEDHMNQLKEVLESAKYHLSGAHL